MRGALQTLQSSVDETITQANGTSVPDDESCQAMHGACTAYMNNSRELSIKYGEMIDYMVAHNPATEVDIAACNAITAELESKDEDLFSQLVRAQERMASEFDIELE